MLMNDWQLAAVSTPLSRQLMRLAAREREVAAIVYAQAGATAKQVEAQLSAAMTNSAVRSMLVRLVRKGILTRRAIAGVRGRGQEYLYLPALTGPELKIRALRRLSDDFFDGSLADAAQWLQEMVEAEAQDARSFSPFESRLRESSAG